jgi:hypothetical protein
VTKLFNFWIKVTRFVEMDARKLTETSLEQVTFASKLPFLTTASNPSSSSNRETWWATRCHLKAHRVTRHSKRSSPNKQSRSYNNKFICRTILTTVLITERQLSIPNSSLGPKLPPRRNLNLNRRCSTCRPPTWTRLLLKTTMRIWALSPQPVQAHNDSSAILKW